MLNPWYLLLVTLVMIDLSDVTLSTLDWSERYVCYVHFTIYACYAQPYKLTFGTLDRYRVTLHLLNSAFRNVTR